MSETHVSDLKFRLMTIDLLITAKRNFTYRELSSRTGLPVTVLSRYVKGHVLPSSTRAKQIWGTLEKLVSLEEELKRRIKFDEFGYFDNSTIISDPLLLQQATQYFFSRFSGKRITKVMTAAVDGIPLATLICEALGTEMVIAKKTKDVGIRGFVEESYIPGNSAIVVTLYIPRNVIRRGDNVLIVDDVIKSGETHRAMVNLVSKCRAELTGIYALIAVGDQWRETLGPLGDYSVEVVLTIKPAIVH
ncbi:adenine phosphoribosyltransferase [Candidatus Bathyarchaeota archaeon]|nr:adenine phosphoribosyltransferase [Candidatus Bathyarchaeota archaeon]